MNPISTEYKSLLESVQFIDFIKRNNSLSRIVDRLVEELGE